MKSCRLACSSAVVGLLLASANSALAGAITGIHTPYFSTADSVLNTASAGYKLEDFEPSSPTLSSLGVTLTTVNGSSVDQGLSVDADDGSIDGSGANGHSLTVITAGGVTGATFTFNSGVIGAYPKSVGIAVTAFDGDSLVLTVYDTSNNVSGTYTIPTVLTSTPTNDDFLLWASDAAGISAISLSSNLAATHMHLDHLQYDTLNTISTVPAPGGLGAVGLAGAALLGWRLMERKTAI